jgi:hypothetical protein
MTGQLWFHFASAILLTAVVSSVIVSWYRHAVTRSMRIAGSAAAELDPAFERELPAWWQRIAAGHQDHEAGRTSAADRLLRRRTAMAYGFGGMAASAVMTVLYLVALGDELLPVRTFTLFYVFCWPIVPTLSFLMGLSRGRELLFVAAYVGVGALTVVILSAVVALGRMDTIPLQNAIAFLQFLAIQASLPFLIILATSGARIRSVAPFVLAGLLVFSFSNLAAGSAMIAALDFGAVRDALLSLGAYSGYNAWYLLAALPIGYACWQGLRWLGRLYEGKMYSDAQLLVDAWWLIAIFIFSVLLVIHFGWVGLPFGLSAFVAYRVVVAAALALWRPGDAWLGNRRLLLLRVFGFQRRTERLFDTVAQRWRWLGSVKIIAGADLATRLIGPGDLISFMGGRLRQLFLRRDKASFQRIGELDEARDPDGRYRVNKVYCHHDSWRPALQGLLATTDFVLMDLRSFSAKNQGCLFELQQLVDQDRTRRTVFVVDNTTDTKLLETVLAEQTAARHAAGERGAMPLNLVFAGSGSAADADKVYRALATLPAAKE